MPKIKVRAWRLLSKGPTDPQIGFRQVTFGSLNLSMSNSRHSPYQLIKWSAKTVSLRKRPKFPSKEGIGVGLLNEKKNNSI